MITFAQGIIFIVSVIGIFCIFFLLTDEEYFNSSNNEKEKSRIIDIYTYNIEEEKINELIKIIEKSKNIQNMVDIVNIHESFDKKY